MLHHFWRRDKPQVFIFAGGFCSLKTDYGSIIFKVCIHSCTVSVCSILHYFFSDHWLDTIVFVNLQNKAWTDSRNSGHRLWSQVDDTFLIVQLSSTLGNRRIQKIALNRKHLQQRDILKQTVPQENYQRCKLPGLWQDDTSRFSSIFFYVWPDLWSHRLG